MWLIGYSLDNLSLMALTISVGFVVDDAIVMIENMARHRERGLRPLQAAMAGGRGTGVTALAITRAAAPASGDGGSAGDRVRRSVHHRVARRGVHPPAVHGRTRRTHRPRVLRH